MTVPHLNNDPEPKFPKHSILGMRLDYLSTDEFLDEFVGLAQTRTSAYCCVPDVYQCMVCYDEPAHQDIVNKADFVFSDSTILQNIRAWRYGVKPIRTLLGSKLMHKLCNKAETNGISIALVGGQDDQVLARLRLSLLLEFPNLDIAYSYSPPFRDLSAAEEEKMLRNINASRAQIVFFGLGCPKQERWMARYKDKINASMIGVGAAFDTISGNVSASPEFAHKFGLEWFFRFVREPRRLYKRYMIQAPRFLWLITKDRLVSEIHSRRTNA